MNHSIRWARTGLLGAAIFIVAISAASLPMGWRKYLEYQETRVSPTSVTPLEFQSILFAVLEHSRLYGVPPPPPEAGGGHSAHIRKPVVLENETVAICVAAGTPGCKSMEDTEMFLFPGADPKIPKQLRRELIAANLASVKFECPTSEWVQCASSEDISSIFTNGGWWSDFYRKYPTTAGVMKVTNPVLSHDGKSALIYVAYQCDGLCGAGSLVMLSRVGAAWVVWREEELWIS